MLGTFPSMQARPGYVGKPMPGIRLEVVDDEGKPCRPEPAVCSS